MRPASAPCPQAAAALAAAVAEAAHLLPAQAPLARFVHHNPLHALEDRPFAEAVGWAAERLGTEAYLSEEAFDAHLRSGRIQPRDLDAVLAEAPPPEGDGPWPGAWNRARLWRLRLGHGLPQPDAAGLRYWIEEGEALRHWHPDVPAELREALGGASGRRVRRHLEALWGALRPHLPVSAGPAPEALRPRDRLLAAGGEDADAWVHPWLIRLCAAFLDQGQALWPWPGREAGFLQAFRELYAQALLPAPFDRLPAQLQAQQAQGWTAAEAVLQALQRLGVAEGDWVAFLGQSLLALKGWAGMFHQLEERPSLVPPGAPPARLMDFLAVRLHLDALAAEAVAAELGEGTLTEDPATERQDWASLWSAFVLAQWAGLKPQDLGPAEAATWVSEVQAFGLRQRQALWHLAFERRHRQGVLDALHHHQAALAPATGAPAWQAIFCMDEREESLRRHLEEVNPRVETWGMAGFFGVAMAHRGLGEAHAQPLGPVAQPPRHLVVEEADPAAQAAPVGKGAWDRLRRAHGKGAQGLLLGALASLVGGWALALPLLGRSLHPRWAEAVSAAWRQRLAPPQPTRLRLARPEGAQAGPEGLWPGYSWEEMAEVVQGALAPMGLGRRPWGPLVVVVGHGASGLNNPLLAAYCCGAVGGGDGGPNARALAQMANQPEVRRLLVARGLAIPDGTHFVGAAHDTTSDRLRCFDEGAVPPNHRGLLAQAQAELALALARSGAERARRFEDAPPLRGPEEALAHLAQRAADWRQPRPEYGHGGNAVCVVGRREKTRGLFMDRRAFLVSYDPEGDADGSVLAGLLAGVMPVAAGINLEYYFSAVDPHGHGCGSKLPHNLTGLLGLMDGTASDLRTGLAEQMVEIHEPLRLLCLVEASPQRLGRLLAQDAALGRLVHHEWVQLVAWDPSSGALFRHGPHGFVPHAVESEGLAVAPDSASHHQGRPGHLPWVRIAPPKGGAA